MVSISFYLEIYRGCFNSMCKNDVENGVLDVNFPVVSAKTTIETLIIHGIRG